MPKKDLSSDAVEHTREPRSKEELTRSKKKMVVTAFYVLSDQVSWLKQTAEVLKRAGIDSTANKSSVVREAITRLQEDCQDKSSAELVQNFLDRKLKRMD